MNTAIKSRKNKYIIKRVFIITLIAIFSAALIGTALTACGKGNEQPMRLHIRANSNSAADQAVKLLVRDEVVLYLESELKDIKSLDKAKSEINKRKSKIKKIADGVLKDNGFDYKSKISFKNEYFPTRMYDDLVLESGYYDALIIELGSGEGDNWWCVIYPPLCYVDIEFGGDFRYKSKIKELWDKYFG